MVAPRPSVIPGAMVAADFGTVARPTAHGNFAGICSFDLYSSTTGTAPTYAFDENVRPDGTQLLTLVSDLAIGSKSRLLCDSVIGNGQNMTFHVAIAVPPAGVARTEFLGARQCTCPRSRSRILRRRSPSSPAGEDTHS